MDVDKFLTRLMALRSAGETIVVAGVGSGLTATGAVAGGADLLAVYNTAVYRIAGLPTALAFLPYDDANALTLRVLPEVVAAADEVPVLAGLGAHDPRIPIDLLLDRAIGVGATGITNEPFLGMYGEEIAAQLDAVGLGFSREMDLVQRGVQRGLIGLGWAFTPSEAQAMAAAGAHIVGAMVGVTAGESSGGTPRMNLDDALQKIDAIADAARSERDDVIVLGHGGPLTDPHSVGELLRRTGVHGFVTGSTGERLPVERGVADAIRAFKSVGR